MCGKVTHTARGVGSGGKRGSWTEFSHRHLSGSPRFCPLIAGDPTTARDNMTSKSNNSILYYILSTLNVILIKPPNNATKQALLLAVLFPSEAVEMYSCHLLIIIPLSGRAETQTQVCLTSQPPHSHLQQHAASPNSLGQVHLTFLFYLISHVSPPLDCRRVSQLSALWTHQVQTHCPLYACSTLSLKSPHHCLFKFE